MVLIFSNSKLLQEKIPPPPPQFLHLPFSPHIWELKTQNGSNRVAGASDAVSSEELLFSQASGCLIRVLKVSCSRGLQMPVSMLLTHFLIFSWSGWMRAFSLLLPVQTFLQGPMSCQWPCQPHTSFSALPWLHCQFEWMPGTLVQRNEKGWGRDPLWMMSLLL